MNALDNFFRHIHPIPVFSFLHKASIIQRYQAGLLDNGLILALFGITAQLTNLGPGMKEKGTECVAAAEAIVMQGIGQPSVIKIQTLILIIKHHTLSGRFNGAFMLLATAARFAFALRLNYEAPTLCFLAQESRRRLMWSLYIVDTVFAAGMKEMTLCPADSIHIQLPCQERNFEFDLEQETEPLQPRPGQPLSASVGSLGLYLRVLWFRSRVLQSTKEAVVAPDGAAERVPAIVEGLVSELDDFAASLPASFQFSEKNLQLRAYSPRLCPYILIHIWLRQCYCELYRVTVDGLQDNPSPESLSNLDPNFINFCHWQCYEQAKALSAIFGSLCNLKSGLPVMDIDIDASAYQCARLIFSTYRHHADDLRLSLESVREEAKRCLRLLQLLPRWSPPGTRLASIPLLCKYLTTNGKQQEDLRKLIERGVTMGSSPSRSASPIATDSPDADEDSAETPHRPKSNFHQLFSRHSLIKQMDIHDDSEDLTMPQTIQYNPPLAQVPIEIENPNGLTPIIQKTAAMSYTDPNIPAVDPANFANSNAFEGAMDGFDFNLDSTALDPFNSFSSYWANFEFAAGQVWT